MAFGRLKHCWRSLHTVIRVPLQHIPSFILVCFILHNYAINIQDTDLEDFPDVVTAQPAILFTDNDYALKRDGEIK